MYRIMKIKINKEDNWINHNFYGMFNSIGEATQYLKNEVRKFLECEVSIIAPCEDDIDNRDWDLTRYIWTRKGEFEIEDEWNVIRLAIIPFKEKEIYLRTQPYNIFKTPSYKLYKTIPKIDVVGEDETILLGEFYSKESAENYLEVYEAQTKDELRPIRDNEWYIERYGSPTHYRLV